MWLCIDRIVAGKVVLLDDEDGKYTLTVEDYMSLVGREPRESDVLAAEIADGHVVSATYDSKETDRRTAEARAMLDRLFKR